MASPFPSLSRISSNLPISSFIAKALWSNFDGIKIEREPNANRLRGEENLSVATLITIGIAQKSWSPHRGRTEELAPIGDRILNKFSKADSGQDEFFK